MTAGPDRRTVAKLGLWFHNLHLPDGQQTCPDHWAGDFPRWK
jgi:tRNA (mo5U34)-methyltransferase